MLSNLQFDFEINAIHEAEVKKEIKAINKIELIVEIELQFRKTTGDGN